MNVEGLQCWIDKKVAMQFKVMRGRLTGRVEKPDE